MTFLKRWEGVRYDVYKDVAGFLTVGVGHLVKAKDSLSLGDVVKDDRVDDLLRSDIAIAENAVNDRVKVALTQNQFNALVSFVFNVGTGAFAQSGLLRALNAGNYAGVSNQFTKWVFAGGRKVRGLELRRNAEKALFLTKPEEADKETANGHNP